MHSSPTDSLTSSRRPESGRERAWGPFAGRSDGATRALGMRRLAIIAAWLALAPAPLPAQQITGEEVRTAIAAGRAGLKRVQQPNGGWADFGQPGGSSCLAALALVHTGEPLDSQVLERAGNYISGLPLNYTYTVSLKIQALAAINPLKYRREIEAAADWLIEQQLPNGMWSYGQAGGLAARLGGIGSGDFSNSQFALLGLHEASQAGVKVPRETWSRAERSWVQAQNGDGGWGYMPALRASTGSMSAAGVASLFITGNRLDQSSEDGFHEGRALRCGTYKEFRPIVRGLDWLGTNFSTRNNPGSGGWFYYYLYALERAGILSGQRFLGRHDWYRAGAARLVRQQQADGSWADNNVIVDTSFALLFLGKGHKPVLMQKLQWSNDSRWNPDRNDVAHLIAFIGDALGEPVSWQVAPLEANLASWLSAPILYMNGHQFPPFREPHVEKLRAYVTMGGTLLMEACCGRDAFRQGFEQFAKEHFPEYPVVRLSPDHPVFHTLYELDGSTIELYGIDLGCRTSIFYSPNDLSCLWEQGDIPELSEQAYRLGANIAAYATGRQPLPDKLDIVRVADVEAERKEQPEAVRGALHIAQLVHSGDWRPDPKTLPNLATYLSDQLGVDTVQSYVPLVASDPKLADHPVIYMTGHFSFHLLDEHFEPLQRHLRNGGFLFAEACCGRKAFDTSFRELAARLFPDHPLEPLPANHPILAGSPGFPLTRVRYRQAVLAEAPGFDTPALEGVTINGRTVLVYSPYGIGCGIDGHACFSCRGVEPEDAVKIAANVMLYALSY